jgi:hypothetical protein
MILLSNNECSITIPANMPIFFPVLDGLSWELINDSNCKRNKNTNENAIQHKISKFGLMYNNEAKNLVGTIDGALLVDDFSKYRVQTNPFIAYLHSDFNQFSSQGCIPLSQEAHEQVIFILF